MVRKISSWSALVVLSLFVLISIAGCSRPRCMSPTCPSDTPAAVKTVTICASADADASAMAICPAGVVIGTGHGHADACVDVPEDQAAAAKASLQKEQQSLANARATATAVCISTPPTHPAPTPPAPTPPAPPTPPGPTVYSSSKSYTATCPSGYTGNPVTRTGTATSTVSQADADAKALADAQASANTALVCTAPPVVCSYSVATNSINVEYRVASGSIAVGGSPSTCRATVNSNVAWLTPATTSGSGNWSAPYSITENPTTSVRNGAVTVSGENGFSKTIPVTQAARPVEASCSYSVTVPDLLNVPRAGTNGSVIVGVNGPNQSACTWSFTTSIYWIGVSPSSGAGNSSPSNPPKVTVGGNTTGAGRDGSVTITGINGFSKTFSVHQGG